MSSNEMDRFFFLLQEQGKTLKTQGEAIVKMSESLSNTHDRLFGEGQTPGVIPYLFSEVNKHGRQITFWKGGIAVLTFMWGAVLTWGGVVISKHAK